MIKPSDIVLHLQTYLPSVTDLFSEFLTVISATVASGNVITITVANHGLNTSSKIAVGAGTIRNTLDTATLDGSGNVDFTADYNHDLIKPSQINDQQTLTLAGFGSVWDGDHKIIDVKNRKSLTVALPSGETTAPTITTEYLVETRSGFNGMYDVASVIDPNNFTIENSDLPQFPIGTIDGMKILSNVRILPAEDIERAKELYTKQNIDEIFAFVIMTDGETSKDRHTINDAVGGFTTQDRRLLRSLQNFSVSVFIPTPKDIAASGAQDKAYGEIYTSLLKVLYGFVFENELNIIPYVTVTTGHGPGEYNTAYYIHVYDWQTPFAIDYSAGFDQQADAAFRDIESTWDLNRDEMAQMILNINLDKEPL